MKHGLEVGLHFHMLFRNWLLRQFQEWENLPKMLQQNYQNASESCLSSIPPSCTSRIGVPHPSPDIWQRWETFLVVKARRRGQCYCIYWVKSREAAKHPRRHRTAPRQRSFWSEKSIVPRLRNSALVPCLKTRFYDFIAMPTFSEFHPRPVFVWFHRSMLGTQGSQHYSQRIDSYKRPSGASCEES